MLWSSSAIASAASTATFCVSTVFVRSAMSCIFSSTNFASFCTYFTSSSPWIEYVCPKICTFTGALMVALCVKIAQTVRIQHVARSASRALVGVQHAAPQTATCQHSEREVKLTGAELRAEIFFEGRNNFSAATADLCFRKRCIAALKRHAHEQRIFPRRNILATEKIG